MHEQNKMIMIDNIALIVPIFKQLPKLFDSLLSD